MAAFQITGTGIIDLRSTNFLGFDGLQFATSGAATAQIGWSQILGPPQLKSVTGNGAFADTLEIFTFGDTDASTLIFNGWSDSDLVIIHDTAGDNEITGTGHRDAITVTRGLDIADGGGGEDTLVVDYSTSKDNFSTASSFLLVNQQNTTRVQSRNIEHFNVSTGSGTDKMILGAGDDTAKAGAGNDTINTLTGDATVDGGAGNDTWAANLSAETGAIKVNLMNPATLQIGGGSVMRSIEALNVFVTGSGNDVIQTRTGSPDDCLADNVNMGAGNDTVKVGGGLDIVNGGADDDLLIVDYSTSADSYSTVPLFLLVNKANTTRVQVSAIERYNISTGSGDDNIKTGSGNDTVTSGTGNDTINTLGGDARVDGGIGTDHWSADLSAETVAIKVDLLKAGINAIGGGTLIGGIEVLGSLKTGSGNDVILTRTDNLTDGLFESIAAGSGNDTVKVGGGHDVANGGDGEDLLIVDYSTATQNFTEGGVFFLFDTKNTNNLQQSLFEHFDVTTGSGNDRFGTGSSSDTVASGAGNDTINTLAGEASVDGGTGIDAWLADYSTATGAIQIDLLKAGINAIGAGSFVGQIETLSKFTSGSGGDSILTRVDGPAGGSNDNVAAGAGNDTVRVGGGSDIVNGGNDDDLLIIDYSKATVDLIRSGAFFLVDSKAALGVQQSGFERFNVRLGSGNDKVTLDTGDDTASGGAGNDSITANAGNDSIVGNDGADTLLGGDGDDVIIGGAGQDALTGGLGKDRFDYNAEGDSAATVAGRDIIADFDPKGQDRIDLSSIDANADGGLANDKFAFMGTAAITGLGQVRFQQFDSAGTVNDITIIGINTTGTTAADMQIQIKGLVTMDAADFVL